MNVLFAVVIVMALLLIVRQIYVANLIHKENIFVIIVSNPSKAAIGAGFVVEN
jgi:hypothetical protein